MDREEIKIIEKIYSELKQPECPACEDPLIFDGDPGVWYCENSKCNYSEYNNITRCQNDFAGCSNLVLSKDLKFDNMEERYCQIPWSDGGNCLGFAYSEQDQFLQEQHELEEHMKHCSNERCDCRNV